MRDINLTEIDTAWGYKAFKLCHDDIPHFHSPVDFPAVSVLAWDYYLLRGTSIGAPHGRNRPDLEDLTRALGRLVCAEMDSPGFRT